MMLTNFAVAIAAISSSAALPDATWIGATDTSTWRIETPSIRTDGDRRFAFVQVEHAPRDKLVLRERFLFSVDCAARRYRPVSVASYLPSGTLVRKAAITASDFPDRRIGNTTPADRTASVICGDDRYDYIATRPVTDPGIRQNERPNTRR